MAILAQQVASLKGASRRATRLEISGPAIIRWGCCWVAAGLLLGCWAAGPVANNMEINFGILGGFWRYIDQVGGPGITWNAMSPP